MLGPPRVATCCCFYKHPATRAVFLPNCQPDWSPVQMSKGWASHLSAFHNSFFLVNSKHHRRIGKAEKFPNTDGGLRKLNVSVGISDESRPENEKDPCSVNLSCQTKPAPLRTRCLHDKCCWLVVVDLSCGCVDLYTTGNTRSLYGRLRLKPCRSHVLSIFWGW